MNKSMNNSYIEVNLNTLRENVRAIGRTLPAGVDIIPVLKDNAYGLGLVPVAAALEPMEQICAFAVSHVSEGMELRAAGIRKSILVMSCALPFQLETAVDAELTLACARPGFASELAAAARAAGKTAHIHIKIDAGLHRIGFETGDELMALASELSEAGGQISVDGAFSHFSDAGDTERVEQEYADFMSALRRLERFGVHVPFRHIACSAASELYTGMELDAVRVGRRLYMDNPEKEHQTGIIRELASWRTYITAVYKRRAGERVGYGKGISLDSDRDIATVGIGYGDGLDESFAGIKAPVLVNGRQARILAVFMDQCLVDVTGIDCAPGDELTVFGYDGRGGFISSQDQAMLISAAEGCGLTSALSGRVARVYTDRPFE